MTRNPLPIAEHGMTLAQRVYRGQGPLLRNAHISSVLVKASTASPAWPAGVAGGESSSTPPNSSADAVDFRRSTCEIG
ncbi:MAG: hypothetical protein Q8Q80_18130 [Methyloversatilis sp.]|uniref:hypothetical protein n=1 Tax=Methyloversatilis sp. TaxID=2569862 RepID=UPI00273373EB|nr:hypothetical protein [Methyloversatilis sp.]MDP3874583.1 hypothetical protein [Methyloversatilis sp.]